MAAICMAYNPDGSVCRREPRFWIKEYGGTVCLEHAAQYQSAGALRVRTRDDVLVAYELLRQVNPTAADAISRRHGQSEGEDGRLRGFDDNEAVFAEIDEALSEGGPWGVL
jgi:hypothetical protein